MCWSFPPLIPKVFRLFSFTATIQSEPIRAGRPVPSSRIRIKKRGYQEQNFRTKKRAVRVVLTNKVNLASYFRWSNSGTSWLWRSRVITLDIWLGSYLSSSSLTLFSYFWTIKAAMRPHPISTQAAHLHLPFVTTFSDISHKNTPSLWQRYDRTRLSREPIC